MSPEMRWWSASKMVWKHLQEMHDVEIRNAFRKFARGEYRLPDGEPLSLMQSTELEATFISEFQRRGLDENGNPFVEDAT